MRIDAHFHVGTCRVFDRDVSDQEVLDTHEGWDVVVVQPYPGAPDPAATHDRIADLGKRTGGRVRGLASLSPHRDRDEYFAEIDRCVNQLGFVGIKLHTIGHALNPMSTDGATVFEAGREFGVPVMIHTGPGIPFADPGMAAPRARQFPDVTIILAHAGWSIFSGSAIAVAEQYDNVYLEPSWCRVSDIVPMVSRVGAGRIMFGSDDARNIQPELARYEAAGLSAGDLDRILGGTAAEVFRL